MENITKSNNMKVWSIWLCFCVFYGYQYILRILPNSLTSYFIEKLQVEANQIGQISGWYYIGYSIIHIPLGIMLDKFQMKYVIPLFIVLCCLGNLPLIYADSWQVVTLGRFFTGIGSSAAILGLFKIIRNNFDDNKFSMMVGLSLTIGLSGAIYGGKPMASLMEKLGEKQAILGLTFFGLVLALILLIITPIYKISYQENNSIKSDIKNVLTNSKFVVLCLIAGLMVGPIEGFADAWCTQFLIKVQHMDKDVAAYLPSIIFIGLCFGAPILAYVANKTSYLGTIAASAVVMGGLLSLVLFFPLKETQVWFIFLIVGCLSSYQTIIIYKSTTYFKENLRMLASACANMILMSFGFVFHSSIGKVMDMLWDKTMQNNVRIYSASDYQYSLAVVPIACVIATIGLLVFVLQEKSQNKVSLNNQESFSQ